MKYPLIRLTLPLLLLAALLAGCGRGGAHSAVPPAASPTPELTAAPELTAPPEATAPQDLSTGDLSPDELYTDGGTDEGTTAGETLLDPDGTYSSMEDVALYLHTYGQLPDNFITKADARALGWSGGGLESYAPGMCIGGDTFGNREGLLPQGSYHECDVGTLGESSRGAERIVWDQEGNIYYTGDHYESFQLLYAAE